MSIDQYCQSKEGMTMKGGALMTSGFRKLGYLALVTAVAVMFLASGFVPSASAAVSIVDDWASAMPLASTISGSTMNSGVNFTPSNGTNRIVFIAIGSEGNSVGTINSVSLGGATLTPVVDQAGSSRNALWLGFLPESQIGSGGEIVVNWNAVPNGDPFYFAYATYGGADQNVPPITWASAANTSNGTSLAVPAINMADGEQYFYVSLNGQIGTHTTDLANSTEKIDIQGQSNDSSLAVVTRNVTTAATNLSPTATWTVSSRIINIAVAVKEAPSVCIPSAPTVNISTAPIEITTNGGSAVYNFTVTNNDIGPCASRAFALSANDSAVSNFNTPSVLSASTTGTLAPGATSSTFTLTATATSGTYTGSMTSTITASEGTDSGTDQVVTTSNVPCSDSTTSYIQWNGANSASGDFSGASFINAVDVDPATLQYKVTQGSGVGTPTSLQLDDWTGYGNSAQIFTPNWTDDGSCWYTYSGATTPTGSTNAAAPISGDYVYLETSSGGTNPCGLTAGTYYFEQISTLDAGTYALTFNFDFSNNAADAGDSLYLDVWNGTSWDNQAVLIKSGPSTNTESRSIDLDTLGYNTGSVKVRFEVVLGNGGTNFYDKDLVLDNMEFIGTPRNVETTVIDWTTAGVDTIPMSGQANGTYNLYVQGKDLECGINTYYGGTTTTPNTTAEGAAQTFSWIDCNISTAPSASVTGVTSTSVTLSWPAVTGASSYMVNGTDVGNVLTYTVTGLAANTAYNIDVNGVGTASCAGPVATVAATTLPAAPAAPTYANPTASSVDVSWSAVGGTEPVTYALTQVAGSTVNPAASPATISGLSPNTAYQFYVNATNAGGTGANSTTSTAPYTLALVPGAPTVNGATSNSLNLAIGTDGNPAATTYAIRINGGSYTNQYVQSNGSVGATAAWQTKAAWGTTTVTGLALGTIYSFDVKARNGDAVETTFGTASALSTLTAVAESTGSTVGVTTGDGLISVTASYSGDFPTNNNTLLVQWQLCGDVNATCDGTTFTNGSTTQGPAASPYNYDIIGLTNGNKYQLRITLSDPDGTLAGPGWTVSGADVVYVVTDVVPSVEMLHNAASTGSTKWGGTWGLPGGKYGAFSCDTCHTDTTNNIKRIKETISFPDGSVMPNGSTSSSVTLSDTRDNTSDYADASGAHATSNGVCEVCHSYDGTQANGVHHHGYDMSGATAGDQNHFLQLDCMTCHNHKSGFLPTACDSCHGNPPTTPDTDGSTNTGLVHTTPTGSTTPGAHDRHTNATQLGFDCKTCHNGYVMPNGGDIDIHFNADFSATGGGTSSSGSYGGQTGVSYNGAAGDGTKACSNVYCHGGTISGNAPTWDGTVACGDCHGASQASPPATGSHLLHVGTVGAACTDCHGTSAGAAGHMNGDVHWDVSALGASATYNGFATGDTGGLAPSASYGTCSNVSCHYNNDTPVWGSSGISCDACHGQGANVPWPNIGAHNAHFAALGITTLNSANEATVRTACNYCHSGATHNGTKEVSIDAIFDAQTGAGGATWDGTSQCSNVSCHGGKITPSWASGTINVNTQCTSCHTAEDTATQYNSATSGMHGITGAISGMNHGSTLACTDCHNGPPATPKAHFSEAGLKTAAMSRPVGSDFVAGITLGATSDDDTCAMTCHKEGADANRGTSAPWARLNNKTWASGAGAAGDLCKTCHGIWGDWRGNVLVDHTADWDGDGTPEVQANHSECETCHGFSPTKTNANYNAAWYDATNAPNGMHGNGEITMNGPSPSTGAGYNESNFGCDNACHGDYADGHALADSTWTVGYGDFGAGSCDSCHGPGGSGPTVVWPNNNSGFTGEGYGSHLKAATGDTFSTTTDWATQCQKCHGFHSGDVLIPNNATVGINYTSHGGINLGGTATGGKTTEAEICWNCHSTQGVDGEFGVNTDTNGTAANYDFGTLSNNTASSGGWYSVTTPGSEVGANWVSANFSYKTGAIQSTHSVNDAETGPGLDPVADIRCSYCHDVHNTAFIAATGITAQDGPPYLRGTWMGSPYREDGAPRTQAEGQATYTGFNNFGAVPRGSTSYVQMGGYQIDQNNNNPTAAWTADESSGLCELCHGSGDGSWNVSVTDGSGDNEIDRINKFGTASTDWVGTNGHSNAVLGGTGNRAADIFNVSDRNSTTPSFGTSNGMDPGNPAMAQQQQTSTGRQVYSFRSSNSDGWRVQPRISSNYAYGNYNWGATISSGSDLDLNFHKFSCSKCHNPHASRLPRLMITNCLDTNHNTWDTDSAASGPPGTIPSTTTRNGDGGAYPSTDNAGYPVSQATSAQNCHRRADTYQHPNARGTGWNNVTPWQEF